MLVQPVKWINKKRPQCSHRVDRTDITLHYKNYLEKRLERTGKHPDFCGHYATHEVNGVYLCRQHAAERALEFLEYPKIKIILDKN